MDSDARSLAINRLGAKEYAAGEMLRYLQRKGVSREEAQGVVDDLVAQGLISDSRFAAAMAREQAHRGKGPRFLRAKLFQKGINLDERQIRELFQSAVPDEESQIIDRVLERRYPRLGEGDSREFQRAFQGLLRRGFSLEVVKAALARAKASRAPDPAED